MNFSPSLVQSGMRGRMAMSSLGRYRPAYHRGMRGLGDDYSDLTATGYEAPPSATVYTSPVFQMPDASPVSTTAPSTSGVIASAPGATGGFDWGALLSTATKAVATFGVAKLGAQTQQQQIAAQAQTQQAAIARNPYSYSISPSYVPGVSQPMPAWIPVAGIGLLVGAFFLLR
jgi:hypothetical protein